ncbi:hypothetical protein NQ314_016230 [Rhamnusium bicolor]|uniref:PiggyBac transposable element-derived protein domain-containing protein n=1 Tax=Rhamnusium bicolor TaxID=1586634 RepID=A0AAV8WWT2_9CUCU|nr:hypothetical protein NQ314_016230 [Rhamnusium bicolor]
MDQEEFEIFFESIPSDGESIVSDVGGEEGDDDCEEMIDKILNPILNIQEVALDFYEIEEEIEQVQYNGIERENEEEMTTTEHVWRNWKHTNECAGTEDEKQQTMNRGEIEMIRSGEMVEAEYRRESEEYITERVDKDQEKQDNSGDEASADEDFISEEDISLDELRKTLPFDMKNTCDRKGFPKDFSADKSMQRGDSEWRMTLKGLTALKWKDSKGILFASNFHNTEEVTKVQRKTKDGSRVEITCLMMVKDYNENMDYVDKSDQLKSYYEIDRKRKRWWLRIFWHFIDLTIVNAFILFRIQSEGKSITLKDFRTSVARGLIGILKRQKTRKKSEDLSESAHLPLRDKSRRCGNCSTKESPHRNEEADLDNPYESSSDDFVPSTDEENLYSSESENLIDDENYYSREDKNMVEISDETPKRDVLCAMINEPTQSETEIINQVEIQPKIKLKRFPQNPKISRRLIRNPKNWKRVKAATDRQRGKKYLSQRGYEVPEKRI